MGILNTLYAVSIVISAIAYFGNNEQFGLTLGIGATVVFIVLKLAGKVISQLHKGVILVALVLVSYIVYTSI